MAVIDDLARPPRRYDIIYADPPWPYYGDPQKWAAAGKHYPLMAQEAINELPVRTLASPSAALFLWATSPRLPDALQAMASWGFHYRGVAYVWVKTRRDGAPIGAQGIPPTFVKPTSEFVLVGTTSRRGRPFPILDFSQRQVIMAPRGRHSEKPAVFRDQIVKLCGDRPRIELFAREQAPGWDCWGAEAGAAPDQAAQ